MLCELLERLRLELLFHLREAERVVFFLVVGDARTTTLGHRLLVFIFLMDFLDLFLFLVGGAGGLFGNLAVAFLAVFGEAFGCRILRQHRVEIEDLAQLHRSFVERVRPGDDGVEGDRALAEPQDHRVAAGLDALGDGDFAFAAEQLDRAHLAQIHAHRVVGAIDGVSFFFSSARRASSSVGSIDSSCRVPRRRALRRPRRLRHSRRC